MAGVGEEAADDGVRGGLAGGDEAGAEFAADVRDDQPAVADLANPCTRNVGDVGAWDVPLARQDQVAPDGRLVVPMRLRGDVSRSVVFEREGDHWLAVDSQMCGFMPLRCGIADDPQLPWGAMACAEGADLAYLTRRGHELGVIAHGPGAAELMARLVAAIREWNRDLRDVVPRIALQPLSVEHPIGGQFTFTMPRNRLTISWT